MTEPSRPLPDPNHPLYGPHWQAAAAGRLEMQRCETCGHVRWPPEPGCPECLAAGGTWVEIEGVGTLWSYAVYDHAFNAALRDDVPYICGLVELDSGPRLISRIVDVEPDAATIGMRVAASFEFVAPGIRLVCFGPGQR